MVGKVCNEFLTTTLHQNFNQGSSNAEDEGEFVESNSISMSRFDKLELVSYPIALNCCVAAVDALRSHSWSMCRGTIVVDVRDGSARFIVDPRGGRHHVSVSTKESMTPFLEGLLSFIL